MRHYIFHITYRNDISKEGFLLWTEIFNPEKEINKIATKDDLKTLALKEYLNFDTFESVDFMLPHKGHKQFLSETLGREEKELELKKKYADCVVVPFHYFPEISKKLEAPFSEHVKKGNSWNFYVKVFEFALKILNKGSFYPDICDDMVVRFFPEKGEYLDLNLDLLTPYLPEFSLISENEKLDKKKYIEDIISNVLNSLTFHFIKEDSYLGNTISKSNENGNFIFDEVSSFSNYDQNIVRSWKSLRSPEKLRFGITFKKLDENNHAVSFGIFRDKKFISGNKFDTFSNFEKEFFIKRFIDITKVSETSKSVLVAGNDFKIELTTTELLYFLKNETPYLISKGVLLKYPQFWKHLEKARVKISFRKKKGISLSKSFLNKDAIMDFNWEVVAGNANLDKDTVYQKIIEGEQFFEYDGRYIELDTKNLINIINGLKKQEKKYLKGITLSEGLNYDISDDYEIDKSEIFDTLASNAGKEKLKKIKKIKGFEGTLRKYQTRGVEFLSHIEKNGFGSILADDMGLGKTIQIIALLLHKKSSIANLIIAPTTLLYNWEQEINKFAPQIKTYIHYGTGREKNLDNILNKYDVILVSYGVLKKDISLFDKVEFERVIIDEAQNIKNPSSEQSNAVKQLTSLSRIALTGTPIENRLMELWSIMDFCNPGLFGSANSFAKKYETPIAKQNDSKKKEQLKEVISPFIIRRLKSDSSIISDLPEKQESKVYLPLSEDQILLYDNETKRVEKELEKKSGKNIKGIMLSTITKLKQICNHPLNYNSEDENKKTKKRSYKLDRITHMVREVEQEGLKTIIFTQFVSMGNIIKSHLEEQLEKDILFFNGKLSILKRRKMIEQFESDPNIPAMVLSLRAGGFGLNLTSANYVVHYDRWWNPAVENQAVDRVHRIGQTRNTFVYKFICKDTLEEKIDKLIEDKMSLSDGIIPKGDSIITDMSKKEFIELIKR